MSRFREDTSSIRQRMKKMEDSLLKKEYDTQQNNGNRNLEGLEYTDSKILRAIRECTSSLIEEFQEKTLPIFTVTSAAQSIQKYFTEDGFVFITGLPGEGKTTIGMHLLDQAFKDDIEPPVKLILDSPEQFKQTVDPSKKYVILIDDIFGKTSCHRRFALEWCGLFHEMFSLLRTQRFRMIFTSREFIYNECAIFPEMVKYVKRKSIINLSGKVFGMNSTDKKAMLQKFISVKKINLPSEPKTIIIKSSPINFGFPLCLKLFIQQKQLRIAFKTPQKFLIEDIDSLYTLDQTKYIVLALLFFVNSELSVTRPEQERNLHLNLLQIFDTSELSPKALEDSLSSMKNTYVTYSKTFQCYRFMHESVLEAMFLSLSKRYPKKLINFCPLSLIDCFAISDGDTRDLEEGTKTDQDLTIHLPPLMQFFLHERIFKGIEMKHSKYFEKVCGIKNWHIEDTKLYQDVFLARDLNGWSLLVYAAKISNIDLIQIMLEAVPVRSDEMASDIYLGLKEACRVGNSRAYFCLLAEWKEKLKPDMAFAAVEGGDLGILQNILKDVDVSVVNEDGDSLIMTAARRGHFECVKMLGNLSLDLIMVTSNKNGSAIHAAVTGQNVEVVNWLMKKIMDDLTAEEMEDMFATKNYKGQIALHTAVIEQNYDIVILLVESFNYKYLRFLDKKGENVFHLAAHYGRLEIVNHIVFNLPELVSVTDEAGGTALHHAAASGNVRVFNELLKAGLSPYATTNDGNTVLHKAALYRNAELVRFVIRSTPDILLSTNHFKWTALFTAAAGGSVDVFAELFQTSLSSNKLSKDGSTVLHISAVNRHVELVQFIIVNLSAITTTVNSAGETALHSAAIGGDVGVFKELRRAGLSSKAKTNEGASVLQLAAYNGRTELVEHIIENVADTLSLADSSNRNALHYAAANGDVGMFYDLTKTGLTPTLTKNGSTIMHIAAYNGRVQLCRHIKRNHPEIIPISDEFDRTALHAAAAGGNVTVFNELVRAELSPRDTLKDRVTVLHIAAYYGQIDLVSEIVGNVSDILKSKDNTGNSALHFAAAGGSVDVCVELIKSNLSPLAVTKTGNSLLHLAVENDKMEVVTYIINNIPDIIPASNEHGETALHYAAAAGTVYAFHKLTEADLSSDAKTKDGTSVLNIAAYCGKVQQVRHIMNHNHNIASSRDDNDWSALHSAAAGGSVEVFSELVRAGLSPKLTTHDGSSVLHIAAYNGNVESVQYIKSNIPNIIHLKDEHSWTALHAAAAVGSVDAVEELVHAGIAPNTLTEGGSTILHVAAYHGHSNLVQHIIKTFPDILSLSDHFRRTALLDSAAGGDIDVFNALSQAGLSPLHFQNDGSTVLHIAAANGNVKLSRHIMINVPTIVSYVDNFERTSLHAAAVGGNVELFKKLTQIGLDKKAVTSTGSTVLHIAAENGCVDLVKFIIASVSDVIQVVDDKGRSAIHYAATGGNADVVDALINAGVVPVPSPVDGCSVLHVAAVNAFLDLVRYVINKLPDMVHLTDENGWTALHYAAAGGEIDILFVLIKSGLLPGHKASDGSTVLHKAAYCGKVELVKYIMEIVPELIPLTDDARWTALHSSSAGGNVDVFRELWAARLSPTSATIGGSTVLHIAAYNGQLILVKFIISNVPDIVHLIDESGKTSLHYTAAGGNVDVFNELIQAGVSPQAKTKDGSTVLHIAASNNRLTLVKYITTSIRTILQMRDESGWKALHSAGAVGAVQVVHELIEGGLPASSTTSIGRTVLHVAAHKSKVPLVRYIVKNHKDILNNTDDTGHTALHSAAVGGSVGVFIELLHAGISPDSVTNEGNTVLHIAANNGKIDLVRYIITYVNGIIHISNNVGRTALHCAAAGRNSNTFHALLKAGVNAKELTKSGKSILHEAAFSSKGDLVKSIVEMFPDLISVSDESGRTALHYSAAGGNVESFTELMKAGLSAEDTPKDGSTVLHIASFNCKVELVIHIIDNLSSVIHVVDNSGKTALHHAAASGDVNVFIELVQAGLSPKTTTNDGSNVLHIASYNGRLTLVNYIIQELEEVLPLTDEFGRSALHYAAAGGNIDVFVALLEAGLSPQTKTSGGSTVLHLASANARLQIVKHIMQTDQNYIYSTDEQGRTALHLAASKTTTDMFDMLVSGGLSPMLKDKSGNTPLDLASTLLEQHVLKNYPEFTVTRQHTKPPSSAPEQTTSKNGHVVNNSKRRHSENPVKTGASSNTGENKPSRSCVVQ